MKDEELLLAFEQVERFIAYRNRKSHGNLFLLLGFYFFFMIVFTGYDHLLVQYVPVPLSMISMLLLLAFVGSYIVWVGTGFHSAYKIHIDALEGKKKSLARKREILSNSAVVLILICILIIIYMLIRFLEINFCIIFLFGVSLCNFSIFSVIIHIYDTPHYHTELFWIGIALFISGICVIGIPSLYSPLVTAGVFLTVYAAAAYHVFTSAHDIIRTGVTEEFGQLFSSKSNLSNPVRLGIMILLQDKNGMIFTDIQNSLHLTSGNLDSHLKHLEKDKYIHIKKILSKKGPRTAIYITEEGKDELKKYLSKLRVGLSV